MNPESGKAPGVDLSRESAAGEEDPGASLDGFAADGSATHAPSSPAPMNLSMNYAAEHLMDWLRDAHAMEEQAELLLQTACDRLGSHPVLKARLQAHHQQTREQARMLSECIHRRGGSTSGGKEVAGRMSAMVQSLSARPASDEVINVVMTCYAFEHYEVATYRVMVAVAEMAQDPPTRHVCEEILRQEEATSGWLAEHLGVLTQEFLALSKNAGGDDKR